MSKVEFCSILSDVLYFLLNCKTIPIARIVRKKKYSYNSLWTLE